MGLNPNNAFIAGSDRDAVYLAPIGTPLPANIDTELDPAFEHVGWLHSDGIKETPTGSKSEIRGLQGQGIVRTRIETPGTTIGFHALESKPQTDALRYHQKDVSESNGVRKITRGPGQKVSPRVMVVDVFDADFIDRKKRHAVGLINIVPDGERVFSGSDIAGYPFVGDVVGDYVVYETIDGAGGLASVEPVLTSVAPTTAAAAANVVLTGTGFTGATAVRFGTTPATTFTIDSDTKITVKVPAGAAGPVTIKVIKSALDSDAVAFARS